MTINSETIIRQGNQGDHKYAIVELDITSLESAGTETYDPTSNLNLSGVEGAQVLDQENKEYHFGFDIDNNNVRVKDRGPEFNHKSADPGSQTYSASTETVIATYDAGDGGAIEPLNFNPADPSDADLTIILRATFQDGTTQDLVNEGAGTAQTYENLVDGYASGNDGKQPKKLEVIVKETGGADATEDIGATTTEFYAYNADAENNEDVGTVTLKFEGDHSA